ncbi:MAG: (Fe-S)-binding protein [Dehalococcoidales bacterium]|nr:(Fe-S)-binding protein [Dehalococcoidales bacterium]
MALEDYRTDMEACCRCSVCKFIPMEQVKSYDFAYGCPSIARYNFHAYSGGGRLAIGIALLDKELEYSRGLLDIVYNCQMCGACDVSCKYAMDMDVFEPISEMRIACVERGLTLPVFEKMIASLRQNGNLVPPAGAGGKRWFDDLEVKDYTREKVEVIFHAGCRLGGDRSLWEAGRMALALLKKAGVDVGIAAGEKCCGGRAHYLGYREEFLKQAEQNVKQFARAGATVLVTGCAECYQAFRVLYDRYGFTPGLEVLHISEYLLRLVREGRLRPYRELNMKVTYHDPCYLGRLGEPWVHWEGKLKPGQIRLFDPPREFRRGSYGVYQPPRELLMGIPGITLAEMERNREYAWCCGAGGGVKESNPDFALWTARERLKEARLTGADVLVTACPGCLRNFRDALAGQPLRVNDITELVAGACL